VYLGYDNLSQRDIALNMTNKNPTIWGIHAGKTGDAHTMIVDGGSIAAATEDPDENGSPTG